MKIPATQLRVILVTIVAVISLIFLILLYGITYEHISSTLSTSNKLMHANNVEIELEKLISQLKYAETAQRGFIMTHDSTFLRPFMKSRAEIESCFAHLHSLLAKDVVQLKHLKLLEQTVNSRYDLLVHNLEGAGQKVVVPHDLKAKLEKGNKKLESSIQIMNDMITYQDESLRTLEKKHIESIINTPIIYFTIVVITLIIFTFLIYKLDKERKKLIRMNDELIITNQSFVHAEELAGLGNWRHNFQDNKFTFSDNFYALLGLTPGEKELNLHTFLQMVHPSDRLDVINVFRNAYRNYQPFVLSYRIHSKENRLKYIKSIGRIINDNNNQRYLIGINMDITELVTSNKQLEMKNRKLELFNADLASFNYVASHDLQAPLRKIQMFISRLNEVELPNVSSLGKDYLKRIHASAAHMQILINDLLMFSRTNAGNKKFELTNINKILHHAKEELTLQIEEKEAEIISDDLPVINAIPYQLQQLFINLISNSIKFTSEGTKPVITINCELVGKEFIAPEEEFPSESFYKITFTDNGIGFETLYSEKIFNLLFRLHDKMSYPGSGIGLAICKKIVENHNGIIEAWSEPNKGSKFFIYLPANLS